MPVGVDPLVVTVIAELTGLAFGTLTVAGVNEAVAPVGKPETPSDTFPVKLLFGVIETVYGAVAPWLTDCEPGETPALKSGGPITVIVRVGG